MKLKQRRRRKLSTSDDKHPEDLHKSEEDTYDGHSVKSILKHPSLSHRRSLPESRRSSGTTRVGGGGATTNRRHYQKMQHHQRSRTTLVTGRGEKKQSSTTKLPKERDEEENSIVAFEKNITGRQSQ